MNANSTRQSVIVGLFVLIGAVIVAATLFSVGTFTDAFQRRIPVTATFAEVKGLKPGDAVWFAGVTVGRVASVGFEPEGAGVEVGLRIDEAASTHIPSDVLARVGTDSLIGNTIVVLYDGTAEARHLQTGDTLAVGSSVTPEAMMAKFQENNENLLVITTNLKEVSARMADKEGPVSQLLSDRDLYRELSVAVSELEAASRNARALTADLATFTAEVNTEGNLPHDLVTDRAIHDSLVASTTSLEQATASANQLLQGLQTDLGTVDTPAGVILHSEEAGLKLAATLEKLQASSVLLEQDLEALQHSFLLRGYFKKKDKKDRKGQDP